MKKLWRFIMIPALIGGLAGVTGSVIGGLMQNSTNNQNYKMYQQSREDQNTAHQRAVADMRKAGLNPILAAGQPAGVSQPVKLDSAAENARSAGAAVQGAFDTASARALQRRTIDLQDKMNVANIGHIEKQNDLLQAQKDDIDTNTAMKIWDFAIAKDKNMPTSAPMGSSGIARTFNDIVNMWQEARGKGDGTLGITEFLMRLMNGNEAKATEASNQGIVPDKSWQEKTPAERQDQLTKGYSRGSPPVQRPFETDKGFQARRDQYGKDYPQHYVNKDNDYRPYERPRHSGGGGTYYINGSRGAPRGTKR